MQPRKFKCVHMTTSCLDGHPRKLFCVEMTKPRKFCTLKISQYTVIHNDIIFSGMQDMYAYVHCDIINMNKNKIR